MSVKSDTSSDKCRCCTNPSIGFIKLDSSIKTSEGLEKTYKDILNEITNFTIPTYQECIMPQQICQKCCNQLKSSYKFIQQACQALQQHLQMVYDQQTSSDDVKNIEYVQESLIEIPEAVYSTKCDDEIKLEPFVIQECGIKFEQEVEDREITEAVYSTKCDDEIKLEPFVIEECGIKIKQEVEDSEILIEENFPKKESLEEKDVLENPRTDNTLEHDDQDDSDEPESISGNDDFLSNEPLARRCDICQKVYRNEKFLKIHKRYTHMPEEDKIPCPLCSYRANRPWALRVHMGLAHGQDKVEEYFKPVPNLNKTHSCSLCPRSYAHKDSLRLHMKSKHLNKSSIKAESRIGKQTKPKERFLCTYCGQSFTWKRGLESHILTHSDERPFSCEICNKGFKRFNDLQLHRVIHSDEKPHKCSECGKAFKRVDKLKTHMRVHSELRPYKCNECEKTFKYQSVLTTHMHIHTGHTPFACKTCGEAFSLRTSLSNHCLRYGHVK